LAPLSGDSVKEQDCPDCAIVKSCPATFMFADRPLVLVFAVIE
jgi:hypothetical protein